MNKQDEIRKALRAASGGVLSKEDLKAAVGFALTGQMRGLLATGEVEHTDNGYKLNAQFTPGAAAPRGVKKKAAKKSSKKKKRALSTKQKLREIAAKARVAGQSDVQALAIEGLRTHGKHLIAMVRECVDMERSPELAHAVESFEISERIYQASLH